MKTLLPIALISAAFSSAAHAQNSSPNDGTGYIGASILLNSKHLGSADKELRAIPYLSIDNLKGFTLFGPTLRYRAIDVGTGQGLDKWSLRAGPSIGYQGGRDSDDSPTLTGFDDIGGSVPLGGYIRSTIGPVGLGFNIGKDIAGGHGGVTADATIGTLYRTKNFGFQPSAVMSWGNDRHNDQFFSVSTEQATASGLDAFDADSSLYSYSLGFVSWLEVKENYALTLIANHRWFTSDAADSPILNAEDGSKTGLFVTIGIARKFDTKKW